MLTPTFHFRILNDFVNVFSEQAAVLIGRLEKVCDKGLEFDIFPYITLSALDIICGESLYFFIRCSFSYWLYVVPLHYILSLQTDHTMETFMRP